MYNQFDHASIRLEANGKGPSAEVVVKTTLATRPVRTRSRPRRPMAAGVLRRDDTRMSTDLSTSSCSTCHLEGRDDGHTWVLPRRPAPDPALAGRMMNKTAPYHWSGEFAVAAATSCPTPCSSAWAATGRL